MIGTHFSKKRCEACRETDTRLIATPIEGFGIVYICADHTACRIRREKAERGQQCRDSNGYA